MRHAAEAESALAVGLDRGLLRQVPILGHAYRLRMI
jgi:hypothetical protein